MKDKSFAKIKELKLENDDILMCYSDGLIELKSLD
jgi:serine phosphatase RsbU (regulator of sigma subunit)